MFSQLLSGFFPLWRCGRKRAMASSFWGFWITLRHTTVGRTPLDEWSARRRDLHPTTHNTHNRQTSIPWSAFEPEIPAGERPQTDALDRAAAWSCFSHDYHLCTVLYQLMYGTVPTYVRYCTNLCTVLCQLMYGTVPTYVRYCTNLCTVLCQLMYGTVPTQSFLEHVILRLKSAVMIGRVDWWRSAVALGFHL